MSGVGDFLRGFKPQINDDGDLPVKGAAMTKVNHLRPAKNKEGVYDRYELELETTEVLDGNVRLGKRFWRRYYKDNEESIKDLVNDMFTSGIDLDTSNGEEAFEASFINAIDKPVCVRAWGWTPEKDRQGNIVPAAERRPIQQFVIKHAGSLKTKAQTASGKVPF